MIRDFVPARTSLASGVVIKQHLLERNKYPQPQIEWEDLDISGTLKPQWNDYEPGTVEHFEGGAGGVVNPFNYISNTSQSWLESYTTISGSVLILHDSQDEFYNGEYSGSNLVVTNGILNEAYPATPQAFNYKQVHYYGTSSVEDSIFESNFLNNVTSPQNGEILFFNKPNIFGGVPNFNLFVTKYVKVSKFDCNGNNQSTPLGEVTKILVYNNLNGIYVPYNITNINEFPTYYLYETSWPYIPSLFPNQVFDYTVSSSITSSQSISYFAGIGNPSGFKINPWDSVLVGTNLAHYGTPYFNTSSGNYTLENTPNTPLSITASIVTSGSSTGTFGLYLNRQGTLTNLTSKTYSAGANVTTTVSSSYYGLLTDQVFLVAYRTNIISSSTLKSGSLLLTQSRAVSASNCESVIFEPYITTANFYNSDENALLNNINNDRLSTIYQDVDYSAGITEPVNFDLIISGSAVKAAVQDSNYTTQRHIIPRYNGSRSTSQYLNKWTQGDIGTFGKVPTVESLKRYVAYGEMGGGWPPEKMNASTFQIKYLISQDGDVIIPNTSENSLSIVQGTFPSRENFKINSTSPGSGEATEYRKVIRGGSRIEPILYTQSGSAPGAQWNTTMSFEDIIPSDVGAVGNYTALFN
jgi:hypothetical protein